MYADEEDQAPGGGGRSAAATKRARAAAASPASPAYPTLASSADDDESSCDESVSGLQAEEDFDADAEEVQEIAVGDFLDVSCGRPLRRSDCVTMPVTVALRVFGCD